MPVVHILHLGCCVGSEHEVDGKFRSLRHVGMESSPALRASAELPFPARGAISWQAEVLCATAMCLDFIRLKNATSIVGAQLHLQLQHCKLGRLA